LSGRIGFGISSAAFWHNKKAFWHNKKAFWHNKKAFWHKIWPYGNERFFANTSNPEPHAGFLAYQRSRGKFFYKNHRHLPHHDPIDLRNLPNFSL
jgi:hypothetical protein